MQASSLSLNAQPQLQGNGHSINQHGNSHLSNQQSGLTVGSVRASDPGESGVGFLGGGSSNSRFLGLRKRAVSGFKGFSRSVNGVRDGMGGFLSQKGEEGGMEVGSSRHRESGVEVGSSSFGSSSRRFDSLSTSSRRDRGEEFSQSVQGLGMDGVPSAAR